MLAALLLAAWVMQAQTLQWTSLANPDSLQVNAVSYSADQSKVLSATNCHPAHIRLWHSNNGGMHWDYEVPSSLMCMMGAGLSSDGKYLLAVEEMGNILVFDNTGATPDSINKIPMGTTYAFAIDLSSHSQKMVVGGSDGKLQCYTIANGIQQFNINAHASWVTAVQYRDDNTRIASGGSDALIKIWDSLGNLMHTLNGHTDDITALRFSSSGDTLWSSSLDKTIRMWNTSTGSLLQTQKVSNSVVSGMDYCAPTQELVTVSSDKYIRRFQAGSMQIKDSFLQAHNAVPTCVTFSKTGTEVVTGTSNGLVTLYAVSSTLNIPEENMEMEAPLIFPNPSNGIVHFYSLYNFQNYRVMDITGKWIKNGSVTHSNLVNLSDLHSGFYLLQFLSEELNSKPIKIKIDRP